MKTKEEIRATTQGKIPRPANWKPGEKLKEWDATVTAGAEGLLKRVKTLIGDRILVRLVEEGETMIGRFYIVNREVPLISQECREAIVLKCGPGKWIVDDDGELWRRPMTVKPGQRVHIGNWVDLEHDGLALCQEGDVRGYE